MADGPRQRTAMLLIREVVLMLGGAFLGFVLSTLVITNWPGQRENLMALGMILGAICGMAIHFALPRK